MQKTSKIMNKPISKNHKRFIELVAGGEAIGKAYQLTTKNKPTIKTANENGSKLSTRFKNEIASEREKLQKAISHAHEDEALKSALKSVLSKAERLEWLTKLVNGEIKAKVPFVIGGKIMEYPSEPSHNDRIKALAELNKMDGSYAATKQDVEISTPVINFIRANRNT